LLGWAKLNNTITVHYIVVNNLDNFDGFFGVKSAQLNMSRNIKIKYWSLEGATKAEYFLCSSIWRFYLLASYTGSVSLL